MRHGQLLLIGTAVLGLALFGFVAHRYFPAEGGASAANIDVAIANNDLQVGAEVKDSEVTVVKRKRAGLPAGVVGTKELMLGHRVIVPIAKGEFLLPSHLAEYDRTDRPSLPEMRALAVRVQKTIPENNVIPPNERVDVLFASGQPVGRRAYYKILIRDTVVLASEQHFERKQANGPPISATVILLVSYDDAMKLNLARKHNAFFVLRRRLVDTGYFGDAGMINRPSHNDD